MIRQPVPVFIVGSGRSGTTITASLLNRLNGVHIAKETGYIGQNVALLRNIDDAASLHRLVEIVNSWLLIEQWEKRATVAGFHCFCEHSHLRGAAAFLHYVWQLESPVPWEQLEFVGDNTPSYVLSIPFLQEIFPQARFIHMVRDPRDVVCSIVRMRFGADDLAAAAMEWHSTIGCWMMAERNMDASCGIECRYEDLCTSTAQSFERLAAFLGRNSTQAELALAAHAKTVNNSTAGTSAFGKVSALPHHRKLTQPISAVSIGRYRTELSGSQLRSLESLLQYGLRAYGYETAEWQINPLITGSRFFLARTAIRDVARRCWKHVTFQR
jgi:protein-tyrosine sulfotransferase